MKKLTFEERQLIKRKRSEHNKANLPRQVAWHNVKETKISEKEVESKKRYQARTAITRLARTGLIMIDEDNIICTHCNRKSHRYTSAKFRHEDNCSRTAIKPQFPTHLAKRV